MLTGVFVICGWNFRLCSSCEAKKIIRSLRVALSNGSNITDSPIFLSLSKYEGRSCPWSIQAFYPETVSSIQNSTHDPAVDCHVRGFQSDVGEVSGLLVFLEDPISHNISSESFSAWKTKSSFFNVPSPLCVCVYVYIYILEENWLFK